MRTVVTAVAATSAVMVAAALPASHLWSRTAARIEATAVGDAPGRTPTRDAGMRSGRSDGRRAAGSDSEPSPTATAPFDTTERHVPQEDVSVTPPEREEPPRGEAQPGDGP